MLRETWAKQAGQGEGSLSWRESSDDRLACDSVGCRYRQGRYVVALAHRPEALTDDCREADLVVVAVPVLRVACPSAQWFIDGRALKRGGTHAFWFDSAAPRLLTVADWQGDRPWNHARPMVTDDGQGAN